MSIVGQRIKQCRLINKLTLDDVATNLNVQRQAVWKYESGLVTNIPLDNLERMAILFHTTPAFLAGWSDEGMPESPLDESETSLVNAYRSLSPRGKQLLIDRSEELVLLYGKKSEDSPAESV